jgi:hypothetical protein
MLRFGNVVKSTFHLGMSFQELDLTNNHNVLKAPKIFGKTHQVSNNFTIDQNLRGNTIDLKGESNEKGKKMFNHSKDMMI